MTTAFVRRAQYQAASNARATAKVPRNTALLTAAAKAAADAGLGEGERADAYPIAPVTRQWVLPQRQKLSEHHPPAARAASLSKAIAA